MRDANDLLPGDGRRARHIAGADRGGVVRRGLSPYATYPTDCV